MKRNISAKIWLSLVFPIAVFFAGFVWFCFTGILWQDILTFLIFYQIGLFGIAVTSHKLLSHRSFKASPFVESIFFTLGSCAFQYSPLYWAAFHRKHHQYSDKPGDPHSPWAREIPFPGRLSGWAHAHCLWAYEFDFQKCADEYAPDLLSKPHIRFFHRHHTLVGLLWILLAGVTEGLLLGSIEGFWRGLYWGGIFRILMVHNSFFALNSFGGHGFGFRNFETRDKSTNNFFFFPLLLGECWHNNHHAYPNSASNQKRWFEFDPHYDFLRLLQSVGLITDLRPFPKDVVHESRESAKDPQVTNEHQNDSGNQK